MGSPTDQAQQKDTLDGAPSGSNSLNLNPSFLNEAGGNSMGMVMAALQSLGSNTRASNPSDGEQQPAAHNEDPGAEQGQGQLREQIILEQFKLAQLKQLQEIQQQIFQQQMALLNSGTASLESQARDQTQRRFHGLPTPGSSTEIRPSQPIPVEFVSPMLLNFNDIDSSSIMSLDFPGQNPYPRNNTASHNPVFPPRDPVGLDMNVNSFAAVHSQFGAGGSTVTGNNFASSPPFHATSNTGGGGHARAHDHYIAHRGTASAPAHIAFGNGDNSNIGFGVVGDSPSPVDLSLSMPPPAAPASAFTPSTSTRGTTLPEPLVPVTPASIMNLGNSFVGLGGGLGSVSQNHNSGISAGVDGAASSSTPGASGNFPASTSAAAGGAAKPATKGAGRGAKNDKNDPGSGTGTRKSGRRGGGGAATGDSTGLKHILPATNPSPPSSSLRPSSNLNSTSDAATSSTTTIVPVKERKTSHKAAEQKRRDSLKTTFDDLRGLLPPIPLPTDGDSKSGGTAAVDDEIGFIALAKASLLPGALPPRGPPKVGEGPNKGTFTALYVQLP
ncbi:hypothetical protein LENED_001323 [Lentinula edodes]|uniref:BHLH domain-containing protein n=1 Tax=Lentinula edodes TaxID=5353 RepID=A0A1Q3DY21_LENED|nr:hypothetical protein LENED_001323 [Lentinula edodes]